MVTEIFDKFHQVVQEKYCAFLHSLLGWYLKNLILFWMYFVMCLFVFFFPPHSWTVHLNAEPFFPADHFSSIIKAQKEHALNSQMVLNFCRTYFLWLVIQEKKKTNRNVKIRTRHQQYFFRQSRWSKVSWMTHSQY